MSTLRVISVIGRFLEHSRLWRFANCGSPEYFIGSADWMPRNFDRRVEAVVPVEDPALHPRLDALLDLCLNDNRARGSCARMARTGSGIPGRTRAVRADHLPAR